MQIWSKPRFEAKFPCVQCTTFLHASSQTQSNAVKQWISLQYKHREQVDTEKNPACFFITESKLELYLLKN